MRLTLLFIVYVFARAVQVKIDDISKLLLSVLQLFCGHLLQPAIAARSTAERLAVKHAEHHLDELIGQRLEEIAITAHHAERATSEITHARRGDCKRRR